MASSILLDIKMSDNDHHFQSTYDSAVFDSIIKYLKKEIDVSTAAERVTQPVALYEDCESTSYDSENIDKMKFSVKGYLWELWGTLNEIIKQIPYDHPWLDDIVDLLATIKLVKLPSTKENLTIWGQKFDWINLPIYGPKTREDLDKFTPNDVDESDKSPTLLNETKVSNAQQFASFVAFLAKITIQGVADYKLYAIWILRAALEEIKTPRMIAAHVTAAAVWILYAGTLIYNDNTMYEYGPRVGDPARAGTLWLEKSKHGFCIERWNFWKQRFLQIASTCTDIQSETVKYAKLAASKMDEIEENYKVVQS